MAWRFSIFSGPGYSLICHRCSYLALETFHSLINYVGIANIWFVNTSDILWKGRIQGIPQSIEILGIYTTVQRIISKAYQAIILHDVRFYSFIIDMKRVSLPEWLSNFGDFVKESLRKILKIQNFCFYHLLTIPICLIPQLLQSIANLF